MQSPVDSKNDDYTVRTRHFDQVREKLHHDMFTSFAHDLKTPLSAIIGSLEIYTGMESKLTYEKKQILINTALQEAYRLNKFITNILDMAKLEHGEVKPRKEPYDMALLMQDSRITMGHRLDDCNLEITGRDGTFQIATDHMLLSRAICILLDNAVKHSNVVPVEIRVWYEKNDDIVTIRVQDNGPGVPQAKKEEIFSKYTRLSKLDHKDAVSGLGLPICREIMRLLGGTVSISNLPTDTGGAIFTIALSA